MLTARQIDRLLPLLSEKNNNVCCRNRTPKCLFGTPDGAEELYQEETLKFRESFRRKWDFDVRENEPVTNGKNYTWITLVTRSEILCNQNETNSSENLVIDEENCKTEDRRLKRSCGFSFEVPKTKKKRQAQLTEIWKMKKPASSNFKSS